MIAAAHDQVVQGYLDALLQPNAAATSVDAQAAPAPNWYCCRLGPLQLLLPADRVGAPIATAALTAPETWHRAHVRIGTIDWQVMELGVCVAPGLATAPIDTLLPFTGSAWLLGVAGQPEPSFLADDAIAWRAQRSSRPWLSGMSRDGQYMALDVQALIAHVTGDRMQESQA